MNTKIIILGLAGVIAVALLALTLIEPYSKKNTGAASVGCDGHKVGETWTADDGCNTCACSENGMAACTLMACVVEGGVAVPEDDGGGGTDGGSVSGGAGAGDCKSAEQEIMQMIREANVCEKDSDCTTSGYLQCPFGCWALINRGYDFEGVMDLISQYRAMDCTKCAYNCIVTPDDSRLSCVNSKCVADSPEPSAEPQSNDKSYCEQDSDCVRKNSCCDCGVGEYVNKDNQADVDCDGQPACGCPIAASSGKCVDNACQAMPEQCGSERKCPDGYVCYDSRQCTMDLHGSVCGEQLGDLKCYKICNKDNECAEGEICRDVTIFGLEGGIPWRICRNS